TVNITAAPSCTLSLYPPPCGVFSTVVNYQICGPDSLCGSGYASLSVTGSSAPVTTPDAGITNVNTPITIDVLANDSPPYDSNTLAIAVQPAHGTITSVNTTSGDITYSPNLGYFGLDTYQYRLCDQAALCNCVNTTVTIIINVPPTVPLVDMCFEALEGNNVTGNPIAANLPTVLDPNTFFIVTPPIYGTAFFNNNTSIITYVPPSPTFTGLDDLTYAACTSINATLCGTGNICFYLIPTPVPIPAANC